MLRIAATRDNGVPRRALFRQQGQSVQKIRKAFAFVQIAEEKERAIGFSAGGGGLFADWIDGYAVIDDLDFLRVDFQIMDQPAAPQNAKNNRTRRQLKGQGDQSLDKGACLTIVADQLGGMKMQDDGFSCDPRTEDYDAFPQNAAAFGHVHMNEGQLSRQGAKPYFDNGGQNEENRRKSASSAAAVQRDEAKEAWAFVSGLKDVVLDPAHPAAFLSAGSHDEANLGFDFQKNPLFTGFNPLDFRKIAGRGERFLTAVRQEPIMKRSRSIVFYLPNLAGGGIERVILLMAAILVQERYKVTFLLQTADGALMEKVPSGVRVVAFNVQRTRHAFLPLVRFLQTEKPDLLFSSFGHNNIMALWAVAFSRTGTPVILSQHNALSLETVKGQGLRYSKLLPLLYRLFLPFADAVVAVSQGVADDMAQVARIPRDKIDVIYNPVVSDRFQRDMNEPCDHLWFQKGNPPVILGVGRLVELKDFRTLIDAFAKVRKTKNVRLVLLGEGPLRDDLIAQAESLGLKDFVDLPGFYPNPLPFMRQASVLALTSLHEGFGNVLVEAMACGTPVVSTDCAYGPSEILADGKYGRLVPVGDAFALADALLSTLDAPMDANVLRARGKTFSVKASMEGYLTLFDKVCGKRLRHMP